ncbi:MAG TPA: PilN domain-containing protein [Dictyoglomaceae bacterium]|nr:PilN domain-containing protein [Dictyoglomaceae bacterium]HOL38787.1 PilN domain-containing protein [Dictyoglomaceae bacterium]HOP94509.1 PilN domain-containing protein [Dictyoglomaceae bacterium]HPP15464.1 PilN domain-containing protein [Dictyoglomaceae bacterium]HPU43242.1 PilN domain-containing protein [Dictyoglomaceae bacterium]
MFKINLLPREAKKKEVIRIPFLGILITIVGIILLFGELILYMNLSSELKNLRNENVALETQINNLKDRLRELQNLQDIKKQYEEKIKLSDEIGALEVGWLDIFGTLNRITPKNLWIKTFSLDSTNNVNIEGFALSYRDVAIFLDQLDKTGFVDGVSLGFAQKVGNPPMVSINFRIVAQYKRGEQ